MILWPPVTDGRLVTYEKRGGGQPLTRPPFCVALKCRSRAWGVLYAAAFETIGLAALFIMYYNKMISIFNEGVLQNGS